MPSSKGDRRQEREGPRRRSPSEGDTSRREPLPRKKVDFDLEAAASSQSRSRSPQAKIIVSCLGDGAHKPPPSLQVSNAVSTPVDKPAASKPTPLRGSSSTPPPPLPLPINNSSSGPPRQGAPRRAEDYTIRQDSFDPKKMSISEIDRMLFELDKNLKSKKKR
mmetsp:Transcript_6758/g.10873  ORF Transcript_6758/g.10873 Transcript_6758/m.10873 type:complete len:163 (-) Transcript_6758:24-512(-)